MVHDVQDWSPARRRRSRAAVRFLSRALALLLLAALTIASSRAGAQSRVRPFAFDARIEAPLLGLGGAIWLTSELLKPRLAPPLCRVCDANAFDGAVQHRLRWSRFETAHRISDALLFGIVPAAAFATAVGLARSHGSDRTALVDAFMVAEALVITANLTQLTKYAVGRERPYVRTQRDERRDFIASPDDHLSFFSGHTSITFTLAVATATTASLRGYREAPVVWGAGLTFAALTAYLRIAADRHYLSDVLTGALLGSAVGALVPWLHARAAGGPALGVAPPGTLSFTWTR